MKTHVFLNFVEKYVSLKLKKKKKIQCNWVVPWKSGYEGLKEKVFGIDLIFIYIYYTLCPSVIN